MDKRALAFLLLLTAPVPSYPDGRADAFEDQKQYELFYEYLYQANFVEALLLECTGTRAVSYKFAGATASITAAFNIWILKLHPFSPDPFTGKPKMRMLKDEVSLMFTRDSARPDTDPATAAEPVLMAQKDVLKLMGAFNSEKDALCDFIFWEEVLKFEDLTNRLVADTNARKLSGDQRAAFAESVAEGRVVLDRLFKANPLKNSN